MKKILALIVPLIALVGGALAGNALRPADTAPPENAEYAGADGMPGAEPQKAKADSPQAWFSFSNQFFVPVARNGRIGPIMILTITLETTDEALDRVSVQEHKLRDAILRSMLIFANTGGFDGNFTAAARMRSLREAILIAVQEVAGDDVTAILIEDIARQDG